MNKERKKEKRKKERKKFFRVILGFLAPFPFLFVTGDKCSLFEYYVARPQSKFPGAVYRNKTQFNGEIYWKRQASFVFF